MTQKINGEEGAMTGRILGIAGLIVALTAGRLCADDPVSPPRLDDAALAAIAVGNTDLLIERYRAAPLEGIRYLAQCVKSLDPEERFDVIYVIGQLAVSEFESITTPEVTEILAQIWLDQQGVLEADSASDIASDYLFKARADTFSPMIKERIAASLEKHVSRDAMLVAGAAGITEAVPMLRAIADDEANPLRGQAQTALARMGLEPYVSRVVEAFRKEPDLERKVMRRINSLIYIRRPEGVAALGDMLMSDDRLRWKGQAESDRRTFPVAKLAAEAMAKIVADFPVKKRSYSDEDIARCREWWQRHKGRFDRSPEAEKASG